MPVLRRRPKWFVRPPSLSPTGWNRSHQPRTGWPRGSAFQTQLAAFVDFRNGVAAVTAFRKVIAALQTVSFNDWPSTASFYRQTATDARHRGQMAEASRFWPVRPQSQIPAQVGVWRATPICCARTGTCKHWVTPKEAVQGTPKTYTVAAGPRKAKRASHTTRPSALWLSTALERRPPSSGRIRFPP